MSPKALFHMMWCWMPLMQVGKLVSLVHQEKLQINDKLLNMFFKMFLDMMVFLCKRHDVLRSFFMQKIDVFL